MIIKTTPTTPDELTPEEIKDLIQFKKEKQFPLTLKAVLGGLYRFEKRYKNSSNPLYVFEAYRFCRQYKLPPDEWILSYFDSITEGFLNEADKREKGENGGERAAFTVYEILGMKRDVFNNHAKRKKHFKAVSDYVEIKEKDPSRTDEDIIMALEEKYNTPYKTIYDWIRKWIDFYYPLDHHSPSEKV